MASAVSARPVPPRFCSFSPVPGSRLLLAARGISGRGEQDCTATAKRLPALPWVVPAARARLSGCASLAACPELTARRLSPQCAVQVKLELGHRAQVRKKPTVEGFTHDWMVFVRGPEHSNIQHFVEKVVFHLHESFPRPKRGEAVLGNGRPPSAEQKRRRRGPLVALRGLEGSSRLPRTAAAARGSAPRAPAAARDERLRDPARPLLPQAGTLRTLLRRGGSGSWLRRSGPSPFPRRRSDPAASGVDENLRSGERVRRPGPCGRLRRPFVFRSDPVVS